MRVIREDSLKTKIEKEINKNEVVHGAIVRIELSLEDFERFVDHVNEWTFVFNRRDNWKSNTRGIALSGDHLVWRGVCIQTSQSYK